MTCPVHGPGYGRCLGCLAEAQEAIRLLQTNTPTLMVVHSTRFDATLRLARKEPVDTP